MTRPVRLLIEARTEFDESVDWYARQSPGLGEVFLTRITETLEAIGKKPEQHRVVYRDVRRVVVSKFPYVILYREKLNEVVVISVFHTSRDPSIWKARV